MRVLRPLGRLLLFLFVGASSIIAQDTIKPSNPTGLVASNIAQTSLVLSWNASTDNVGVNRYIVFCGGSVKGEPTGTSFLITGLSPGTTYSVAVAAFDAAGNGSSAQGISVTTAAAVEDTTPPSQPTGLTASNITADTCSLSWTASSDNVGVANYVIFREGVQVGVSYVTSYTAVGLAIGTTNMMTVAARDAAGNISQPGSIAVTTPLGPDTSKPSNPTGLVASNITQTSLVLSWNASTDNVGVDRYIVFCGGSVKGQPTGTSFLITGLSPGTTYSVAVAAFDAAGNGTNAQGISVTTAAAGSHTSTVMLTSPEADSTFTLPVTIELSAATSGPVVKIEYFNGLSKLGESSSAPYTYSWTPLLPGSATLKAVATDGVGAQFDSPTLNIAIQPSLPYIADFEANEGYVIGSLDHQLGWRVSSGSAEVTAEEAAHGTQSVTFNPGAVAAMANQLFGSSGVNPPIAYVDFSAKPVAGMDADQGTLFDVDAARIVFIYDNEGGRFLALDGDGVGSGTWNALPPIIALTTGDVAADWQRITIRLNYSAGKYDLYLNGVMIAADIDFRVTVAPYMSWFSIKGHASASAKIDSLYAGAANPLFADINNNGIDDVWETTYNLPLDQDNRQFSPTGDGLTVLQAYLNGANPNDVDGDGIADAWEKKNFGTTDYGPAADPGGVGRTILESYEQNLSPWPSATVASGLRAWYRADLGVTKDAEGKVSRWVDVSGNGTNVEQPVLGGRPRWRPSGMGSGASLEFDGADDLLRTGGLANVQDGQSDMSVIVVIKPSATQAWSGVIDGRTNNDFPNFSLSGDELNRYQLFWYNTSWNRDPLLAGGVEAPQMLSFVKSGTQKKGYLNGEFQGTADVEPNMQSGPCVVTIGNILPNWNPYKGQIAEILIYNRALTDEERQRIETQMISKYALAQALVHAGGDQSMWFSSNGSSKAWGRNSLGQLGNGSIIDQAVPADLPLPATLKTAAFGNAHGLGIDLTGDLYVWGDNYFHQLGDGLNIVRRLPHKIVGVQNVRQVAAGDSHSLALLADGSVWSWGGNQSGQLGDGSTTNRGQPIQVPGLAGIVAITAGASHSAALGADGAVWVWGSNEYGQLGDAEVTARATPTLVPGLSNVRMIVSGRHHLLALKLDGTVIAWGANQAGQLGLGNNRGQFMPQEVPALAAIKSIAAGDKHSVALASDGTVWTWGGNEVGQLGNGTTAPANTPALNGVSLISDITSGRDHVLVVAINGNVWAWGANGAGQLGAGIAEAYSASPIAVTVE